jgi:hypothetical protein
MTDNTMAKGQQTNNDCIVCHCLSYCLLAIVWSVIVCPVVLYPLYCLLLMVKGQQDKQ